MKGMKVMQFRSDETLFYEISL